MIPAIEQDCRKSLSVLGSGVLGLETLLQKGPSPKDSLL